MGPPVAADCAALACSVARFAASSAAFASTAAEAAAFWARSTYVRMLRPKRRPAFVVAVS